MDNIYHQYWQQELMYQLASADRCRKRAYVCSPFRADTREQREKNLRTARAYMFYANKKMNMNAAAPHAYLPLLLCDEIPAERAIALRFGLEILEQSDVMLVCGNKHSNGMRGEIAKAALLRMPITVFDEGLYLEVQKLVTQNNGNKKSVKLDDTSQLDMLDLGYASTIHKSQGSEYRSVIINLQCAHYVMLTRPLVYTAITRGKENVIIVGERRALCMAIKKTDTEKRGTCLAKRLRAAMQ